MTEIIVAGISLLLALLSAGIAMYHFARSEKKIGCLYFICVIIWFPWLWLWDFIHPHWWSDSNNYWIVCPVYALWSAIPGIISLALFLYSDKHNCKNMRKGAIYGLSAIFYGAIFAGALIYIAGTR